MSKKRVALVGASVRVCSFVNALKTDYSETHEIVAVFDVDPGKMRGFCEIVDLDLPIFTDFDAMCDAVKPDMVIITTVDQFHSAYVVRALDRKIGVISEKPLCINEKQCRDIIAARNRNSEVFAVTSHNARYSPHARKLYELVQSGTIGRVITASYSEMLDRYHGASYFRRWNSEKKNTGGLQFHKSSHHFDELNWIIGTRPAEVNATGALLRYGAKASPFHGETCHTCDHDCPWRVRYEDEKESSTYRLFYKYAIPGGYTPDLCIFRPEIDIEDFLNVGIKYENGVYCCYNLTAQANYEGQTIIFDGELGRLECRTAIYRNLGTDIGDVHDTNVVNRVKITLCRYGKGEAEEIPLTRETGGHGGADNRIFDDLFGDNPSPMIATLDDGIQAVMVGAAINESLRIGGKVDVQKLLQGN